MQIGMIGLGRIGDDIVRRLQQRDHKTSFLICKLNEAMEKLESEGTLKGRPHEDFVARLDKPRKSV